MNRKRTAGLLWLLLHPSPFFRSCLSAGFAVIIVFLPVTAFAQTARQMDALLETKAVSFSQAAGIIIPAAGLLEPEAGPEAAFERAREWLPRRAEPEAPISMGELSQMVMGAFGLSGGFMYAISPGPRYAYRALAWLRLLPPRPDPYRRVSGEELLYITGRVLAHAGEAEGEFKVE
jgi:hypothetical protein